MPDLTVVATAHARPERLRALLDALAGQGAEVVVVADGATPAVLAVLDRWDGGRVLRLEPGRGPAAARNAGWRATTGRYVAFTDDDCVPSSGWTAALLSAAAPDRVVQGPVEPLVAERDRIGPFARTLWVRGAGPFFQTANVLYPRALLERLGGFDEGFPAPAGEDTDLGLRALEAGASAVFAPDALVEHAVHEPGWRGLVADAPRWGSAVRLVKRHPGLRREFVHRVFWKPAHERLVLMLAGALLARRSPVLVAGLAWWARAHAGEHPSSASLLRSLPAHLAVDGAEVVALVRGSARERTLFL